jgi:2-hydroxy-3-keto-5-methylthiopentenyl-1-phosphate phosphatase
MTNKISLIIDFDDTIVESNTARDVLRDFVPSEYDQIAKLYRAKNINFRTYQELSFEKAFKVTDSSKIKSSSIKNSIIRSGFKNLVKYCEKKQINIYVLSSGLDMYISPVLKKFEKSLKIIAAEVYFDKNKNPTFEYKRSYDEMCSPDWGICKCKTVEQLRNNNYLIYVGDGITTDLCASVKCDEIFALNPLYNGLLEKKINVNKFENFEQLEKHISKI